MEKRAEGFWWVRHVDGTWQVAEIVHYAHPEGEAFEILLPGCKGLLVDEEKASRIVEWGPYLGKDPGRAVAREAHDGVEVSMDGGATWPIWVPGWQVDRDVAMEAKRAAAYEPSTDYEGEDTRALDGAGVEPSIDALVRVVAAHEDGPPVGTEGRLYRIDHDEPRFGLAHHGWARDVEVIGPPRAPEQRADDIIRALKDGMAIARGTPSPGGPSLPDLVRRGRAPDPLHDAAERAVLGLDDEGGPST